MLLHATLVGSCSRAAHDALKGEEEEAEAEAGWAVTEYGHGIVTAAS